MPHEDTENFHLDDLDDDGDGDGEVETPAAAPAPKPARRPRKTNNGAHAIGVGAPSGPPAWKYQEADLLISEVLEELSKRGLSPYDFVIRVSKLPEKQHLATFELSSVMGDSANSPGDQLIDRVTDNVHLRWTTSPQRYDIAFVRKVGAAIYARGQLSLASAGEIMAIRAAKVAMDQPKLPSGIGQPQAMQQQPQVWPLPEWQRPPHQGVGAPPASTSDEVTFLRQQLRDRETQNEQMRQEVLAAAREGRQPVIQAAAPMNPTDARIDRLEKLVERLIDAKTAAVGVGAPLQQPGVVAKETGEAVGSFRSTLRNFRELKTALAEAQELFGSEEDDDDNEPEKAAATPVVATPEKKEDILPFDVAELPTSPKWSNGEPVRYARNRDTGNIDWLGAAMSNPHVAEKAVDIVNRVGEAILGAAKRFAEQKTGVGAAESQAALPAGVGGSSGEGNNQGGGTPSI